MSLPLLTENCRLWLNEWAPHSSSTVSSSLPHAPQSYRKPLRGSERWASRFRCTQWTLSPWNCFSQQTVPHKKAINDTGQDSETIVCYVRTVGDVRVVDAIVSRSAGVLTLVASIRVLHRTLNRLCRHSAVRRYTRLVCKPTLSQKKQNTQLLLVTPANANRYLKFFHWQILKENLHVNVVRFSVTLQNHDCEIVLGACRLSVVSRLVKVGA